MPTSNSHTAYGNVTKTFHWLTALIILTIIPLGVIANRLPYSTDAELAQKAQLFSIHKTLGVVIFFVALARILWALGQPKPGELHPDRKGETMLAELVHWLLYVSLVAVPLTGWIHHAATSGFAPIWLPIGQNLPLVPKSEQVADLFGGLHWVWSKIMVASIFLHIAGALKHQFVDKDATLRRMWFGNFETPQVVAHRGNILAPIAAFGIYALATGAGTATGMFSHDSNVGGPALDQVASDWVVNEGTIGITVIQLGGKVDGSFGDWTSAISFDPDGTGTVGSVETTIAITSLALGSVTADAMKPDYFDAETFPTALFQADIIEDNGSYAAIGTLTIKGNTQPATLPFTIEINGDVATMQGSLALDRREFNVGESMTDEESVGFNVDVNIALTATRGS